MTDLDLSAFSDPSIPEPEPTPEPEPEPESTPEDDGIVTLPDGSSISAQRLAELAQIDAAFRTNPQIREAVTNAVRGTTVEPTPEVTVPEEIDLQDPTVRFLWEQQRKLASEFEAQRQQILARESQNAYHGVQAGLTEVAKKHNLNPDEIAQLNIRAGEMIDLNRLAQARGGDWKAATVEALELAAMADPNYRTKFLPTGTPSDKQQKLNALAGGSGVTPKSEPDVSTLTPEQRKQAAIAELASALKGGPS